MAVGAKDSEMIKLKYFLKDLGLYKVTKGVHWLWAAPGSLCGRATVLWGGVGQ